MPDLGMVQINEQETEPGDGLYTPLAQGEETFMSVAARADGSPLALTGPVRDAVVAVDADTPIYKKVYGK
ncbi:MAG: hypothetical protein EXR95_08470 [Gemmatimonadetes bacterium]|nr:hypothetical protein [Gemmatimonadota bacterium]